MRTWIVALLAGWIGLCAASEQGLVEEDGNLYPSTAECSTYCINYYRFCTRHDPNNPEPIDCDLEFYLIRCPRTCEVCIPCEYVNYEEFEQSIHLLMEQEEADGEEHTEREDEIEDEVLTVNENLMAIIDLIAPEVKCNSDDDCLNGGSCSEISICTCPEEYKGSFCNEDVDECDEGTHTCGSSGTCENSFGGYNCECKDGYYDHDGECEDIDECASGDVCGPNSACYNSEGSYSCMCENSCLYMESQNGIGCDPTWYLTEWSDWGDGECSCWCGDGKKTQTRQCHYYDGSSLFDCESHISEEDENNPCDNSTLVQEVGCNDRACKVEKLAHWTSDVSSAATDDKVAFYLYDSFGSECKLYPLKLKNDNQRDRGEDDYFNDSDENPEFPVKCADLCLVSDSEYLSSISVVNTQDDGWKWDKARVTIKDQTMINWIYDNGVNWFKKSLKVTYTPGPAL